MDKKVKAHFRKVDPLLFDALVKIEALEELAFVPPKDYFSTLCRAIVGQQLSTKVARVIFERFKNLFPKKKITSSYLLKLKHEDLRKIGLSNSKANYIRDLAEKVENKELILEKLPALSDEEIITELTKVKGIGRWTAEMFLIFTLGREDVFSHGDLGLKNAVKNIYGLKELKIEVVEKIVVKWSPYRSYASRILWRTLDQKPV